MYKLYVLKANLASFPFKSPKKDHVVVVIVGNIVRCYHDKVQGRVIIVYGEGVYRMFHIDDDFTEKYDVNLFISIYTMYTFV